MHTKNIKKTGDPPEGSERLREWRCGLESQLPSSFSTVGVFELVSACADAACEVEDRFKTSSYTCGVRTRGKVFAGAMMAGDINRPPRAG